MNLTTNGLEKLYTGKTKDVYAYNDNQVLLYTKDETTGWWKKNADGEKYFTEDPGGNEIGPAVEGMGKKNLYSSEYYFAKFHEAGLPTHYVASDSENNLMLVDKATPIGNGLECIVRNFAFGSFLRRFPEYTAGQVLTDFFETTLKDDQGGDPPISKEELVEKGVLTADQYEEIRDLSAKAAKILQEDLEKVGLTLVDVKFEIGSVNGKLVLIDEVSAGIMRVAKGEITSENILNEEELAEVLVQRAGK